MSAELNHTIDALGRAFEEFKAANNEQIAELRKNGVADPVLAEKVDRLNVAVEEIASMKAAIEKMEAERNRLNGQGSEADREAAAWDAFRAWAARGTPEAEAAMAKHLRVAAVNITTGTDGGNAVPEVIDRSIARKLIDISPMRQICQVVTVSTSDYKKLVDTRGATSGWVGETGTVSETSTPSLQEVAPTMGEIYAEPRATQWSLEDVFFDVEGWLNDSVATEFAYQEGAAFISGNGTSKPTGFLDGVPVTTGDDDALSPPRTFGILQYFPSGAAGAFANSRVDSPPGDPGDVFLDVVYGLKAGYRANARWLTSKLTIAEIRKFKDADGNYLWAPGLASGEPATLVGYPITEAEDMPAIAANSLSVAFGDFREGYLIVDRVGMTMLRDPYTSKPYTKFYTRKRVGGKLINDDAIKLIKMAAS